MRIYRTSYRKAIYSEEDTIYERADSEWSDIKTIKMPTCRVYRQKYREPYNYSLRTRVILVIEDPYCVCEIHSNNKCALNCVYVLNRIVSRVHIHPYPLILFLPLFYNMIDVQ